jgi:hypothetical protein
MRVFSKLVISAAALALSGGLAAANAAPLVGKAAVSSGVELVAEKKKMAAAKKAKPAAKAKAKKAGPGRCGVGNYWDKKTKKCASAAAKK